MTRTFRTAALAVASLAAGPNLLAQEITLRAGTLIKCTLEEPNFSSRTAQIGEPVICHLHPQREFGYSVFPRGAYLVGHFADYQDPGRLVGKGWLKLDFDRLILGPNTEVSIAAKVVALRKYKVDAEGKILGRGHPRRDVAGWLFPPLWPIKVMTLPARGPRPTLKGEVPLTLRLMDDVSVPCPRPQTAQARR